MLRILLVIDDYNELVLLQTLLKKIGFDVDGIQNQRKFEETVLTFNPQVVIATARGKRVDGIALIREIIKRSSPPKLILLKSQLMEIADGELEYPQIEYVLESPVQSRQLLTALATIGDMDVEQLLEKYAKIKPGETNAAPEEENVLESFKKSLGLKDLPEPEEPMAAADAPPLLKIPVSTLKEEERRKRHEKILKELPPPEHKAFDPAAVRQHNRALRASENPQALKSLEDERKSFVRALFGQRKAK